MARWITEAQAERARAESQLHTATQGTGTRMSRDDIAALVHSVSDLAAAVRQADPEDKAELYRRLGLQLAYAPCRQTVRVTISPVPGVLRKQKPRGLDEATGFSMCVRGGT
ncbi:hypothetical protein [Streptomyces sp. KL2]|uniref:hypothetical protein n=1 Tax=Streptomyces sp. KL2 TaxID=3050126 RepID=UPI003979A3A4